MGLAGCPASIDPYSTMGMVDIFVIDQVAEGLFTIDVTTNNSEIIYNLATHHEWNDNATELTCVLRKKVKFHDGTPFNAAAVKWNFDRIYRLIDNLTYPERWLFPDGRPIINETQIIDDYTVKFVLNAPYVPLRNLMASRGHILSPAATPSDEFINVYTGKLVGTGPFIYNNYEYEVNLSLSANPYYWGGKPDIDKLIFYQIDNIPNQIEALLSGDIDIFRWPLFNETILNEFRDNSSFIVQEGLLPFVTSFEINNKLINATMRKAISYALNYSALFKPYENLGKVVRSKSPIPEVVLYHNITGIKVPYYNISIARQVLKDTGWPGTANLTVNDNISAYNEWEMVAKGLTPLATYNYDFVLDWGLNHTYQFIEDLKQIGVKIEYNEMSLAEYYWCGFELYGYNKDMLTIAWYGWMGDFNDPINFINPFFSSKADGHSNFGQFNDTLVQQWMEEAIRKTNPTARERLYYKIQKRLIEELYPQIWELSPVRADVYASDLRNYYFNSFKLEFKSVSFI
ncbi:MAG: ABC transporter substrate-binding protein [Promethearchaeota archaeon]